MLRGQSQFRRVAERLSRGVLVRRRMPRDLGSRPIFLSPDSQLQYLMPRWERASRSLLQAARRYVRPRDRVWDIGANCGVFAVAAAHLVGARGEVLAVEADPFLAAALIRTATHRRNSDLRCGVLCAAASDRQGIARLMIAARGRASNSLQESGHRSQAGGIRYMQPVPTFTLDALSEDLGLPDFLKIDVEGAEEAVLNGARRLLRVHRPRIYVEVGEKQEPAVRKLLCEHDYRLFDGDGSSDLELDRCSFNTLAVPRELCS